MISSAANWQLSIDRGPDWLFVKLWPSDESEGATAELADRLWTLLSQHFTYRLVLEMDEVDLLSSALIAQFVALQRRIREHGGTLRLCGLSDHCEESLRLCQPRGRLATHHSRLEAVLGHRPTQPR